MTPDPSWLDIAETAGMGTIALVLLGLLARAGQKLMERGERREETVRQIAAEHAAQTELLRLIADAVIKERKGP